MDKNLLYKFFAGTASFEEEDQVCTWVEVSQQNMDQFQKERRLYDAILLSDPIVETHKVKHLPLQIISIAASLILFAICGYIIGNHPFALKNSTASVVVVPPTERANVILPDGTSVWLNSESKLSYEPTFSKKNRVVNLEGEAQFDVVKDAKHPFLVHTSTCDLKVRGTKFNVRTGDNFEAALFEGALEITETKTNRTIDLKPMQKVNCSDGNCTVSTFTDMNEYRWKDGLICLNNESFPRIMDKLSAAFGVKIQIRYKALSKYSCSGKFRTSDGLDYILQVLQRTADFSFSHSDDGEVVFIDPPVKK
jgi:ferric-dicitrate binding protein FerR (iron transport regulator)